MENVNVAVRMELCRECLGLRGGPLLHPAGRTQRCACEPKEPLWPSFDFNTAVELCWCCSATTIRSGSRWSLYYCEPCKARVLARNKVGAAIPLGRHSMMNGIARRVQPGASIERGADPTFDLVLDAFASRIHRLERWHRDRVRAVVQQMGGRELRVPLDEFVEFARARRTTPDAEADSLASAFSLM